MKFTESKFLPYNWKTDKWDKKNGILELSPLSIKGITYNIPPKIFNKPFELNQIHMFYRSDEDKVIITQERDDYPLLLKESKGTANGYNHDQFLIYIEFSKMGKGYVRVSLYEEGNANPIQIDKFKPWVMCNPCLTFGYDSSFLNAGNYFFLFDNIIVDINEFNKYESFIEDVDKEFKWRGSKSFSPTYYLSNGMLVLPFCISR